MADTTGHADTDTAATSDAPDELSALMCAAQEGDAAAYHALLWRVTVLLRRCVRSRAPWLSREDSEELVQDILLSVHQARASYDPARPFLPWLMTITRNRMADHGRRYYRRTEGERDVVAHTETFCDRQAKNHADTVLDHMALQEALRMLPGAQREAVRLLRLRQMSLGEAAEASGSSATALKVSLHRATARLRQILHGGE